MNLPTLLALALMTGLASAKDLKDEVQGKWIVDVAATQQLPENKEYVDKMIKRVGKKEFLDMWLPWLGGTKIELTEKGYEFETVVDGEDWSSDESEIQKSEKDRIEYKESLGRQIILYKKEKVLLMDIGTGETLVLKRVE